MKNILLITIFLSPFTGICQDDQLARLSIAGNVSELGISPSEEIWVATKAGNVYRTKCIGELWHIGPFGSLDPYNIAVGNTFERINFFSEDTIMISGFIQEVDKQNFVYWSGNHGRNWEKVVFGKSSWLDAAYVDDKGKGWMSGSSQLIYFTDDKGKNWKSFDKVEGNGNLRFSTVHFAKDEKTGLFGSFYNVLYRTRDNCKTWEKLPTPLSQNKYQRLSKEERPDIRKVRQLGDQYIVNQQGRVFISSADNIEWRYLTGIVDFELTESGNLYTINRASEIEFTDNEFNPLWKAPKKIEGYVRAIGVKNESLFVLTDDAIYKINRNEFIKSELFTNDIPISEPYLKITHKGVDYGFDEKDVLVKDKYNGRWGRLMTLDFAVGNAVTFENKLIISDASLNKYYSVNLITKSLDKFELPSSLFDLSKNRVEEFYIEMGSQGCFHSRNNRRSYVRRGKDFEFNIGESKPDFLAYAPSTISDEKINEFVKIIDESRFKKITLSDLELTENDIASFHRFVENQERRIKKNGVDRFDYENLYAFPGENADFDFYQKAADSIPSLPGEVLDKVFWQEYGNWSTTTDWSRIIFVFKDKTKLIVQNSDDKPNYLFTPWTVEYEGLKFKTNSIKFGQSINEITNGAFFGKTASDKNYAIFKIADYLYHIKLQSTR